MRDVSNRDISTVILGNKISMPLGVAPTAMQKMAHPDGECANAKGKKKNIIAHLLLLLYIFVLLFKSNTITKYYL